MKQESFVNEPGQKYAEQSFVRDGIIDVCALDWNRVWRERLALRGAIRRDASFWDGRAPSFAKAAAEMDYANRFLSIMKPEPGWTVFDMGCGSGALALPLAKRVSAVTAVDFSGEMLSVVRSRCQNESIANVEIIRAAWEDDWEKYGIGTYDAAVASRSLVVEDLRASIAKLHAAARKRVYIVTVAGDGPGDRRLFDAIGRPFDSGPDYIYYYNLLYQMGIPANVAFIEEARNRTYESPEEAWTAMQWMFDDMTSSEKEKLAAYLGEHLVFQFGSWRLSYSHNIRWAVIWWKKE